MFVKRPANLLYYRLKGMNTQNQPSANTITFLGTAGARFMVSRQLAASGGMWLNLGGTQILLDPGPGCVVQSAKRKLNAEKLSAIILSHRHLDHSGDTNVMVEAMTDGGFHRHGLVFAPPDAFDKEPVLFSYLRRYLDGTVTLEEGRSYSVDGVTFSTPVKHLHPVDTFGLVFKSAEYNFAYIADTLYFKELKNFYKCDMLIINMVFTRPIPPVQHLAVPDARRIIEEIKPRVALLSHFGMQVWMAKPWLIAEELTQQTGVNVIAARDGMKFDLTKLEVIKKVKAEE
jgi:ribonuclease BN (tRNA processing enzyme)